jgi:hypothetical protein
MTIWGPKHVVRFLYLYKYTFLNTGVQDGFIVYYQLINDVHLNCVYFENVRKPLIALCVKNSYLLITR